MPRKRPVSEAAADAAVPVLPQKLLRLSDVSSRTCLSRSEIYRRISAGTFPGSVKLGARAVAWRESDIDDWICRLAANAQSSDGGNARG